MPSAKKNDDYLMVVEDDNLLLEAILKTLKLDGYIAEGFASGIKALRYLQDGNYLPKLIWLDFYIQDTNGLVFVKILKENPDWTNIPVAVVSGKAIKDETKYLHDLGVSNIFHKDDHEFADLVRKVTSLIS